MGKRMITYIVLAMVIIMVGMFFGIKMQAYATELTYEPTEEVLYNPLMGFAPSADSPGMVGENTLVYMDMTWAEIEPQEGVYAFEQWERKNYFAEWKQQGKHVVFRLICDKPGGEAHSDIPDWLYQKTGDGVFYQISYGQGYAPNYENKTLIAAHRTLIQALGERYGGDDFIYYIEFGSLGHWGEFHVKSDANLPLIPGESICQEYLSPYIAAFPNAKFLMRRPYTLAANNHTGIFNDMTGEPGDTQEWLDWIANGGSYTESVTPLPYQPMPKQFLTQPVGGEFTSSLPMETMLTGNGLDTTLSLLRSSHTTFIGPKCPNMEERRDYAEGVAAVQKTIGYRLGIRKATVRRNPLTHQVTVSATMDNQGIAPMYEDWSVCLYLIDGAGQILERVPLSIQLSTLPGGSAQTAGARFTTRLEEEQIYHLYAGIENPVTGTPAVDLNMETEHTNHFYLIEKVTG